MTGGSPKTNVAASVLAVALTAAMFCIPYGAAAPAPVRGHQTHILYVLLSNPATTVCGIWDGVDAQGSPVSGVVYCNGEHVPPDDPRFPKARRSDAWM
jgi:hypothetical protein